MQWDMFVIVSLDACTANSKWYVIWFGYLIIFKHSHFAHVLAFPVSSQPWNREMHFSSQSCSFKSLLWSQQSWLLVENIHPCKVGCLLQNDYFLNCTVIIIDVRYLFGEMFGLVFPSLWHETSLERILAPLRLRTIEQCRRIVNAWPELNSYGCQCYISC